MKGRIRLAHGSDAPWIQEIYARVVEDTPISFELVAPSVAEMERRIARTQEFFPWLVFEGEGPLRGYAYAGRFRPREAYQWTAEVTVYVHPAGRRCGVARALYESLVACLTLQGFRKAVAVIALPNPASIRLHEKLGFESVGVFPAIGYKHDRWHDVSWWFLALGTETGFPAPPTSLPECTRRPEWQNALTRGLKGWSSRGLGS